MRLTIAALLVAKQVLDNRDISLELIECDGGHTGWSQEEPVGAFALVLVRSGAFARTVDGVDTLAEPLTAYLEQPGSVHRIAHPRGGDVCSVITFSERCLGQMFDPSDEPLWRPLHLTPADDLAHRVLLKRIAQEAGDEEIVERVTTLAGGVLSRSASRPTHSSHRIVNRVRNALIEEPDLGLGELASTAGISIYHLSRVFKSATGFTISQYRARLRMRVAMDGLERADASLAGIAVDAGFADQPHMSRTLRDATGLTPRRVREVLST